MVLGNEQNTNTAIRKLRQALRDDAERPRYIATVIGKGYRFIADVCERAPEPQRGRLESGNATPLPVSDDPEAPATPYGRSGSRRGNLFGNKGTILVAFAGLALQAQWSAVFGIPSRDMRVPRALPLTALPGDESEPALSADGRRVAFVWTDPEKTSSRIFLLNAGSVQPVPLTSGAGRDSSPGVVAR